MIVLATVLVLGLVFGGLCLGAWILMLLLGALAALTGWSTAIGFWACLVIATIIWLFTPRSKS